MPHWEQGKNPHPCAFWAISTFSNDVSYWWVIPLRCVLSKKLPLPQSPPGQSWEVPGRPPHTEEQMLDTFSRICISLFPSYTTNFWTSTLVLEKYDVTVLVHSQEWILHLRRESGHWRKSWDGKKVGRQQSSKLPCCLTTDTSAAAYLPRHVVEIN